MYHPYHYPRTVGAHDVAESVAGRIDHLATHSTRIGSAHDLDANGIDLTSIMHSGGRNEPKLPRYYTREFAAQESGVARMMRSRDLVTC